jgi:phosphate transport system permease protein
MVRRTPKADNQHQKPSLLLSARANRLKRITSLSGQGLLLLITSSSAIAVLFIFYFIVKDAVPFFALNGFREFFTSIKWYPSADPPAFGALSIFIGSGLVTLGAICVAVPLGVSAAICLSDVLPFAMRQIFKPIIEILASIPSVAYGFFALVVFAPILQNQGGQILSFAAWLIGLPLALIAIFLLSNIISNKLFPRRLHLPVQLAVSGVLGGTTIFGLVRLGHILDQVEITSGTNALNVSIILGIMALPTVVSVSEDALQAVGRGLREGSYALGATRAETILKVVIPAASSGICAAVILGVMRAVGETMVVWMASGNAAHIPSPWFNYLEPIRTLTATIAGDMGEADQVVGSVRYHVLFAMALCLLIFSFISNLVSEEIVRRSRVKLE